MVSEFASDIDPGPGGSSGRAGHAGSWPACIGFLVPELAVCIRPSGWLPREMDFPDVPFVLYWDGWKVDIRTF